MKLKQILTVLYLILNIYVFCVGAWQGLLNYPAWTLLGDTDFPGFHQAVHQRTLRLYLPFFLLSLPLNFVMIWFRHPVISKGLVGLVAFLNLSNLIVTLTLAIPIQEQLDKHKSVALIEQLVWYHMYLRVLPGSVVLLAIATMLYQLIGKVGAPSVRVGLP